MLDINKFKFSMPIQVRWNDQDALGHVNNALFFTYFEHGRGVYMMKACKGWDWRKHMFLIGNIEARFYKELTMLDENPKSWVRTTKLGNKSFEIEYAVTSEKNGEIVVHASGRSTQVMFDMKQRSTVAMEDWIREELTNFEDAIDS